jgi:hypothetical protein
VLDPFSSTSIYIDHPMDRIEYRDHRGFVYQTEYTRLLVGDLEELERSSAELKIYVKLFWVEDEVNDWIENQLPHVKKIAQKIILMIPEGYLVWLRSRCFDPIIEHLDFEGVYIFTTLGEIDFFRYAKIVPYYPWFGMTWESNLVALPERLKNLNHDPARSAQLFDCLMGRYRSVRAGLYMLLEDQDLLKNGIVTFQKDLDMPFLDWWRPSNNIPLDWIKPDENIHSITAIPKQEWEKYIDVNNLDPEALIWEHRPLAEIQLSTVIDTDIYNNTFFSFVVESSMETGESFMPSGFLTEKIVKPMIAKRLFVVWTNPYALKILKKLGFMTFGDVIDERYDLIQNHWQRAEALIRVVKGLCEVDREELYHKISHILEHNYANLKRLTTFHVARADQALFRDDIDIGFDKKFILDK